MSKRINYGIVLIVTSICLNGLVNQGLSSTSLTQSGITGSSKIFYKYLIIVPDNASWINALQPFIDWKTREGLQYFSDYPTPCEPIKVTNLTEIANAYGSANETNIRKYIVSFWKNNTYLIGISTLKYVLLVGDVKYVPTYLYNVTINSVSYTYATDQYYADFYYPSIDQYINPCVNKTDWGAEVYVGRFPVNTVEELNNVVNKTVTYEMYINGVLQNPGGWQRRMLLLGAIMDNGYNSGGLVWKDGAFVAETVKQHCSNWWMGSLGSNVQPTTLYDTNNNSTIWYSGYSYLNNLHNLTTANIIDQISNVGFSAVLSVSHGNLQSLQGRTSGSPGSWNSPFFYNDNVSALRNNFTLPFWFVDACNAGSFEADLWQTGVKSLGEELFLANPSNCGGVVGFIGCSNVSWYRFYYGTTPNRPEVLETLSDRLTNLTFYELYYCGASLPYSHSKWGLGAALFEAKKLYNETSWDTLPSDKKAPTEMHMATCLGFNLLGDPSLQIWPEMPLDSPHYTISAPSQIQPGTNFTVSVNRTSWISGGFYPPYGPRVGAKVCVSMVQGGNVTWNEVKTTDSNGRANFTAPSQTGILNITVTDHPFLVPYLSQIQVGGGHDIAVTNVTPLKTAVGQGGNCSINAIIANQGDFSETFNITVYANTTELERREITLESGNTTTITVAWNTTGFAIGNYTVHAYATPVSEETDTEDNTKYFDGFLKVVIPGDIDGDFRVSMGDIVMLCDAFGSTRGYDGNYWHKTPCGLCPHNPNCDIDDNGRVDMGDIIMACDHFGKSYP